MRYIIEGESRLISCKYYVPILNDLLDHLPRFNLCQRFSECTERLGVGFSVVHSVISSSMSMISFSEVLISASAGLKPPSQLVEALRAMERVRFQRTFMS